MNIKIRSVPPGEKTCLCLQIFCSRTVQFIAEFCYNRKDISRKASRKGKTQREIPLGVLRVLSSPSLREMYSRMFPLEL